jgi:hypothetical protein
MMVPGKNLNRTFHFEGQDSDEEILFVIHRHWFNILMQFIPFLLGLIAIVGTFVAFGLLYPELLGGIDRSLFFFIENTLLIFLWFFGFLTWIDYYLDVWIITNKRVVNIEQRGLFVRHMSEIFLFRIQDTTSEVKGFFPSILNFGDVYVQSAGERERFVFHKVPDPYGIKDTIMDMAHDTHGEEMEFVKDAFHQRKNGSKKELGIRN